MSATPPPSDPCGFGTQPDLPAAANRVDEMLAIGLGLCHAGNQAARTAQHWFASPWRKALDHDLAICGAAPDRSNLEACLRNAEQSLAQGEPYGALLLAGEALRTNPSHPAAHSLLDRLSGFQQTAAPAEMLRRFHRLEPLEIVALAPGRSCAHFTAAPLAGGFLFADQPARRLCLLDQDLRPLADAGHDLDSLIALFEDGQGHFWALNQNDCRLQGFDRELRPFQCIDLGPLCRRGSVHLISLGMCHISGTVYLILNDPQLQVRSVASFSLAAPAETWRKLQTDPAGGLTCLGVLRDRVVLADTGCLLQQLDEEHGQFLPLPDLPLRASVYKFAAQGTEIFFNSGDGCLCKGATDSTLNFCVRLADLGLVQSPETWVIGGQGESRRLYASDNVGKCIRRYRV